MPFKTILLLGYTVFVGMVLSACQSALPATLDYHFSKDLSVPEGALKNAFITTGLGEVDLISCEDGDTAEFATEDVVIRVRFIGVDTPEASHYYEAWGYEATLYACSVLEEAEVIVLESDENLTRVDNYGRHLAYVWADGTLLNLRLIEQAYSVSVGAGSLKYATSFQQASDHAQSLNERIWSSQHPTFSTQRRGDGVNVSLDDLWENTQDYYFMRVNLEGVITRTLGDQSFLQTDDRGIFLYAGHGRGANDRLSAGHRVRLNDVQFFRDEVRYYGPFLTDINNQSNPSKLGSISVLDTNVIIEPKTLAINELETHASHILVRIVNLTLIQYESIQSSREFPTERWVAEDDQNNTVIIEQSDRVYGHLRYDLENLTPGQVISVIGILIQSESDQRILLTQYSDLELIQE